MLVLDQANSYPFANMVVTITDNTVITDDTASAREVPPFNVLIPVKVPVGPTNVLELFYPGEKNAYINRHGKPNAIKYGFGPDFITGILDKSTANVGVYTINVRGESATMANVVCVMKYRVEKDVPYVSSDGEAYYLDENGQITTSPTDAEPIIRDVLHVRFELAHVESCKKWMDMQLAMEGLVSDVDDDEGYKTLPLFGVMYRGASDFGNNVYFNMTPKTAEYDGNMYYAISAFDGVNTISTDAVMSLDLDAGAKYNTSYFIETLFNQQYTNLRFLAANAISDVHDLFNRYLYTLDDYINGTMDTPSKDFAQIDVFSVNEFGVVLDQDSINTQITNAFTLTGGNDGTDTADALFEAFFKGEILTDIRSVLRYKMHYIPDIGYNDATKKAIIELINNRTRMTTATIMVGDTSTFSSAMIDHQANYYETMPCIRQLPKVQSAMRYDSEFTRRTLTYPASYYDTMALMDHFAKYTNYYQPFAGANCRWTGYIEDTMVYPTETPEFMLALNNARINCVMKDDREGAYLSDQMMNTQFTSDQTEFNNAFLISKMLYDLLDLVHRNHFKFNEAEEVKQFQTAVNDCINAKYVQHSASISVEVYRKGTIGRAKSANVIKVTIDMKDINKFTDVELVLTDN